MRFVMYLSLFTVFFTLTPLHPSTLNQGSGENEFGLFAGADLNLHSASFTQLGSYASCCPEFSNGSGLGPYLGLFYTLPLSPEWRLQARLTYVSSPYSSTYAEPSFVADLRDTPRVREAVFTHQMDATISTLGLEPMIGYRPFGAFDIFVGGSVSYVLSAHFTQTETLTEPADYGEYLGDDRTWVNHDADIPGASSIRATAMALVRYVIPLNKRGSTILAPEVSYHLPLTNVADGVDWTYSEFRFGIALGFTSVPDEPRPVDTVVPPPPPPIAVIPQPVVSIALLRPSNNGLVPLDTITVEETRVIDLLPVLGHVYFDEGATQLPQRYLDAGTTAVRQPDLLTPETATVAVLGVIAQRLQEQSAARITLTGSTSNVANDNGLALARTRAEAVRDALVDMGVRPAQLTIKARQLPVMPTRSSDPADAELANAENRRVEITSTDPAIMDPITLSSTLMTRDPETFVVRVASQLPADRQQQIQVSALHTSVLDTTVSADTMAWTLRTDELMAEPGWITAAVRSDGATDSVSAMINGISIERKASEDLGGDEIERYSLILFAFDNASVTAEHERQLDRIRQRLRDGADVRIIGMTDAMGGSDYNRELSRRRALEVAKALGLDESSIEAMGAGSPRFSNGIPEGRAYNRTVVIEVRSHR